MSLVNKGPGPFPELKRIADLLDRLAEDLDRIADGRHPGADELRDAPLLLEWRLVLVPVPFLVGTVLGHPWIADGQECRTSQVFTFDPETGYARTLSRFYRLGDRSR